jgi:hypothetical protein
VGEFYTAGLAAAPGMNLSLHDPELAAQPVGGSCGMSRRRRNLATGYGHPVPGEQLLCLIFMQIHVCGPKKRRAGSKAHIVRELSNQSKHYRLN